MKDLKKLCIFSLVIAIIFSQIHKPKSEQLSNVTADDYFTIIDSNGVVQTIYYENIYQERLNETSTEDVVFKNVNASNTSFDLYDQASNELLASFATYQEAMNAKKALTGNFSIHHNGCVIYSDLAAVVRMNSYFTYQETDTQRTGYMHGASAPDGAYLGTSEDGRYIYTKISGQYITIDTTNTTVTLQTLAEHPPISYYCNENGWMVHYIYYLASGRIYKSSIRVGQAYSKFASNTNYYSYDGNYFYTSYETMIQDYKARSSSRAINSSAPYYNYYQYLSHRTPSSITASRINEFINSKLSATSNSVLRNTGEIFVNLSKKYGINPMLVLGVAINESGYGTSQIATSKNNIFGHAAYDQNLSQAATYDSVEDSINEHVVRYLNLSYLNKNSYTYYGAHLGNKASGLNVKYASDPYWGEKAASLLYFLQGNDTSLQNSHIAITSKNKIIFSEPNQNSSKLYYTSLYKGSGAYNSSYDLNNTTLYIVGTVQGVDGEYYKVHTDTALNDSRTAIEPKENYSYSHNYGYITKTNIVDIPCTTTPLMPSDEVTTPTITQTSITINPQNITLYENEKSKINITMEGNMTYSLTSSDPTIVSVDSQGNIQALKQGTATMIATTNTGLKANCIVTVNKKVIVGDVNGDGLVRSNDYVLLKKYIMNETTLSTTQKQAADVNQDGQIRSNDYVMIKNIIMNY